MLPTIEVGKSCCEDFLEIARVGLAYAGIGIAIVVAAVASPILGPLGAIACLFKAAYDGIMINYHWRHSREKDANGEFIENTYVNGTSRFQNNIRNEAATFEQPDLDRLKHELARYRHVEAVTDDLRWARGLAKCTIPVIGLIWSFLTESGTNGSFASMGCGCCTNGAHISDERWLQYQIDKLEGKRLSIFLCK